MQTGAAAFGHFYPQTFSRAFPIAVKGDSGAVELRYL